MGSSDFKRFPEVIFVDDVPSKLCLLVDFSLLHGSLILSEAERPRAKDDFGQVLHPKGQN